MQQKNQIEKEEKSVDNVKIVSKELSLSDFEIKGTVLIKYKGEAKEVVIPSCVREIGESAFSECYSLERVVIHNSVTCIHDWAFYNCSNTLIVEYEGAAVDWRNIVVGTNNDTLYSCTINYYNA